MFQSQFKNSSQNIQIETLNTKKKDDEIESLSIYNFFLFSNTIEFIEWYMI